MAFDPVTCVIKRFAGMTASAYVAFYLAPSFGRELFFRGMHRGEQRIAAMKLRKARECQDKA